MEKFIPIARPALVGNEREYVLDCVDTTWISSAGKYVRQFEEAFAGFIGVKHALSCSNGTVALHVALLALGVGPGDEVIVPTLTFVATANAVVYCGAKPVFIDSEPDTWNLDPQKIEEAITPKTKGIIPVHVYGHPVNMGPVMEIARKHGLFVLEDAAEAHGASYYDKTVGSIGDIGAFSFFGNKIVTTGEGGMVVTNDDRLERVMRQLKGQGQDFDRRYWFTMIGYNYRMTNVAAAIGLAQLEKVDWHIQQRLQIAGWYMKRLRNVPELILPVQKDYAKNVFWLFSVVLSDRVQKERDRVMAELTASGVETRPFFYPMHTLPMYTELAKGKVFPVADRLSQRGFNLPTWAGLTEDDVDYICQALTKIIRK